MKLLFRTPQYAKLRKRKHLSFAILEMVHETTYKGGAIYTKSFHACGGSTSVKESLALASALPGRQRVRGKKSVQGTYRWAVYG